MHGGDGCARGTSAKRPQNPICGTGPGWEAGQRQHDDGGRRSGGRRPRTRRHRRHFRVGGVPCGDGSRLRQARDRRSHRARRTIRRPVSASPARLNVPASVDDLQQAMAAKQYVAARGLAVSTFLALTLRRPLFLEGEPGVGKTEVAKVLAAALGTELIRLQCYEGLDVSHAVYEWNYPRQILAIRLLERAHALDRQAAEPELF